MPLRVMQIYLPNSAGEASDELINGAEVLGRWADPERDQRVLHLLVSAEESEAIMDNFEQEYSSVEGFHLVLCPVEAAVPRQKLEEEAKKKTGEECDDSNNHTPRISREELYAQINESIGVTRVFVGLTILSAVVAAVGLMRDDVAVIIGAMVIAPLLGPNVAMSLATTLGDTNLLRRAMFTNVVGIASAFLFAVLIGAIFNVDATVPAIESRTTVNITDILLALAAGSAGTLAFTSGLSGAVIGVMVAVALVPPLVVAGILLGDGHERLAMQALLLTGANVICINLAGIGTFLAQGVRPRTWWEAERAKNGTRKAMLIWTVLLALLLGILWMNRGDVMQSPESQ